MANSLRVSKSGIEIIDQARNKKGWNKDSPIWIETANELLKDTPKGSVSRSTLQRFWGGKEKIRQENFVAICKAVGVEDWQKIVDDNPIQQVKPVISFSAYSQEKWVGRKELISELGESLQEKCRILIITGITGQGKTALAEYLAVEELVDKCHSQLRLNFDDAIQERAFAGAASELLQKMGEDVSANDRNQSELLLNRLVRKLRRTPYLILIDSLEVLLKVGDNTLVRNQYKHEFQDRYWWEFFQALLMGDECQSRLILTSQYFPTQFRSCKNKNDWIEKSLQGLNEYEQITLFKKQLQQTEILPKAEAYLKIIGKAYEGHPLVLEVITREIFNHPFNGNVSLYWNRYHQEFETLKANPNHEELELRVRDRVRKSLEGLQQEFPYAYSLLLRSSVYRHPVPEAFWLEMLWDLTIEEKQAAIKTLELRFLIYIEPDPSNSKFWLRQHNLIRDTAYQQLKEITYSDSYSNSSICYQSSSQIDNFTSRISREIQYSFWLGWEEVHRTAIRMWRTAYKPLKDASNLEKVQGYLEIFHHLCEIKDYKSASEIFLIKLDTCTNEVLGDQLNTWGLYREQIELYERLLGNLTKEWDACCYSRLGSTYNSLGEYQRAIEYHQQSLDIAKEIGDRNGEGRVLGNLGDAYNSLGKYQPAIEYHQQSLDIAREIGDRCSEGTVLSSLGNAYNSLGQYQRAVDYHQRSLNILREIGNRNGERRTLVNLGNTYNSLGKYQCAIKYYQQSLDIAKEIGARSGEGAALGNLGNAYNSLGKYQCAIKYYQQSLDILREIGDRNGEGRVLANLGNAYNSLGKYQCAIEYYQESLDILREIGDRYGEAGALCNLGDILFKLEQYLEALKYFQSALKIIKEIGVRSYEAITLENLAEVYLKLGNKDLALEYCEEALAIYTELGLPYVKECQELKEKLLGDSD